MPHGSSSKNKHKASKHTAGKWDWTNIRNFDLSAELKKNIDGLIERFDHKDFRLSRAWICFASEYINDNVKTNHVSLKFDFKPCDKHPWRGVKLEAREPDMDYLPDFEPRHPISGQKYTPSQVCLSLKDWEGRPSGMRYCVEIETRFDSVYAGTTLGDLIRWLSVNRLLEFGFLTILTCSDVKPYVGCRDYIAQVLFILEIKGRINKSPVKRGDRTIATRNTQTGGWTLYKDSLPFHDIYAALAIFCEIRRLHENSEEYTVVTPSAVERGCFPGWTTDERRMTENQYPYSNIQPIGLRPSQVSPSETNQGGPTGRRGGRGGQGGAFGGQGGGYGRGFGGQGGAFGGQRGGYGGPSGPPMPPGYYYQGQ